MEQNQILPLLRTRWVGQMYTFFSEIDSTNSALRQRVESDDLPQGTLFLTEFQTAGKGRLNRSWVAPAGSSLLFSILFRPNWVGEQIGWLTMMGALAVVEAIESTTAVSPKIKWPNDVVVLKDGRWHKIAGILTEGAFDMNGRLQTAVLGMGININIPAEQLPQADTPASSLLDCTGKMINRPNLFVEILDRIERLYETAVAGISPVSKWQEHLITIGKPVRVTNMQAQTVIEGIAEGVNAQGHLLVRDETTLHVVQAGDVTLREKR